MANTFTSSYFGKYEEKVINGILHYRKSETDAWTPMNAKELTDLLILAREELYRQYENRID